MIHCIKKEKHVIAHKKFCSSLPIIRSGIVPTILPYLKPRRDTSPIELPMPSAADVIPERATHGLDLTQSLIKVVAVANIKIIV